MRKGSRGRIAAGLAEITREANWRFHRRLPLGEVLAKQGEKYMQITQLRLALNNLRRSVQEVPCGIEEPVRKVPTSFEPIPVFRLAVEALMSRRGDALSFVQVGANDGVFVDPLRQYILTRGWSGILVEPQADVFERLKENYADCADRLIFENVAVSLSSQLELFLPPADLGTHDLDTRIPWSQIMRSSSQRL